MATQPNGANGEPPLKVARTGGPAEQSANVASQENSCALSQSSSNASDPLALAQAQAVQMQQMYMQMMGSPAALANGGGLPTVQNGMNPLMQTGPSALQPLVAPGAALPMGLGASMPGQMLQNPALLTPTPNPLAAEIQKFVADNKLDDRAARSLLSAKPHVAQQVIGRGGFYDCHNPNAACMQRIKEAQAHPKLETPVSSENLDRINEFIRENKIDDRAANTLRQKDWKIQERVLGRGNLTDCYNPSAACMQRIQEAQDDLRNRPAPDNTSSELENFIRDNNLDDRAANTLRQKDPRIQNAVMARGSFSDANNPSASCMQRIQDAQEDLRLPKGGSSSSASSTSTVRYQDALGRPTDPYQLYMQQMMGSADPNALMLQQQAAAYAMMQQQAAAAYGMPGMNLMQAMPGYGALGMMSMPGMMPTLPGMMPMPGMPSVPGLTAGLPGLPGMPTLPPLQVDPATGLLSGGLSGLGALSLPGLSPIALPGTTAPAPALDTSALAAAGLPLTMPLLTPLALPAPTSGTAESTPAAPATTTNATAATAAPATTAPA